MTAVSHRAELSTKPYGELGCGGVVVLLQELLTSATDGGNWSGSRPGHFIPEERAVGRR